ncbi:MAG: hypothetical protein WCO03_02670 [bacterium]
MSTPTNEEKVLKILLDKNYISKEDLKAAIDSDEYSSPVDYLLDKEILTKDLLGQAIAESLEATYADLNSNMPTKEGALKIPEKIARAYRIVLFKEDDKTITLTSDNPKVSGVKNELKSLIGKRKATISYSLSEDIDTVLQYYDKPLAERLLKLVEVGEKVAPNQQRMWVRRSVLYYP